MELYRGDTFFRILKISEAIDPGSIVRFAIIKDLTYDSIIEKEITLHKKTDEVELELEPSETENLPIGIFIFEVEVTYSGIVQTKQYEIKIKGDGIRDRL